MSGKDARLGGRLLCLTMPLAFLTFLVVRRFSRGMELACCSAGLAAVFAAGSLCGGVAGMGRMSRLLWLALGAALGALFYGMGL